MSRLILALDQGTTSSRAILFDQDAIPIAIAQRELTQYFPQSGWVEHDALEIWDCQAALITDVLAKACASLTDVAAIGIANQRETTVLWDRNTSRPVARAIVWQDRRTAAQCAQLRAAGHEPEIARRTGLLLDPYFSATKLAWLLEHVPGARARAERGELAFGTIDSWLAWQLTGGKRHVTDATNASRTLLFNLHTCEWDPALLELFGIPYACLPQVIPTAARVATDLTANLAGREVPLTAVVGDQQAALFGQACFKPGMAKNTYGTGCFALMNTGTRPLHSQHRLLTTIAWKCADTRYALEGSVFVGGASYSGCATHWASSSAPRMWRRSLPASLTVMACMSCLRSRAWVVLIGIRTHAASSLGFHVAARERISQGLPSSRSRSRAQSSSRRCSATPSSR